MTPLLFSDADNTLWDTDAVYRRAHLWLFREVAKRLEVQPDIDNPVGFVRAVDQELAESHPNHLAYPPSLLVAALQTRLAPGGDWHSEKDLLVGIETEFTRLTGELPVLREGVVEGIRRLRALHYPVHVMTEGSVERCNRRLLHYGISNCVQSVERVVKDAEHFCKLHRGLPIDTAGWVVGDLLTRDILPARAAGFNTIYFPGSFVPRWEESIVVDSEIIQIKSFVEVPQILERATVEAPGY